MKRFLLLAIAVAAMFTSCSEDKDVEPELKVYPVTFNCSNFKVNTTNTKSTILEILRYDYVLYDANLQFVKILKFDIGATVEDELQLGNYTLCIVGHDNTSARNWSFSSSVSGELFQTAYWDGTGWPLQNSIYYKKVEFEVTETPGSIDITLDDVTGSFSIIIEDAPTDDNNTIEVTIDNLPQSFLLSNGETYAGYGNSTHYDDTYNEPRIANNINGAFIQNIKTEDDAQLYTITIQYKVLGNILKETTLQNIPLHRNVHTDIIGKMFNESGSTTKNGFNISINENWGDPITVNF